MSGSEPFVTYLELRESNAEGEQGAGLSHSSAGLVLLHVLELAAAGEPRGAVTCVHEAGEHGGRALTLARALAENGWAVALPDLRGHGRSEGPRGHSNGLKEVLRDLKDVQDHLAYRQPEAPKVLLGQGLGALYALAHACEQGDGLAGLILIAPLTSPSFALPEKPSGLMKLFKKQSADAAGSIGFQADHLTAVQAEREARAGDELVHDVITVRAAEEAMRAAAEYLPKLRQLGVPVLLIAGDRDPHCEVASLRSAAGSAGIELECIAGGRHDLLHDSAAADVRERIVRWLEQRFPR